MASNAMRTASHWKAVTTMNSATMTKRTQLEFPSKPTVKRTEFGRLRIWKDIYTGDYRITHTRRADRSFSPFVCWVYDRVYDTIDDRHVCGWKPIGEKRTRGAAEKVCRQHARKEAGGAGKR